ncbi:thiol-disulfide oxidoreductase DCC family protein [Halomicrococcus sp. NG-SE-24]|uniref:thiol-disulfide oxidoreductase DCC family protein n=1 Tax=Halomicrococcus sp. NG-SE-24 TaxID=3436928 RepID=UPI003D96FEBA
MTRPLIVYDDDCGFCTWAAEYADEHGEFDLVGFSALDADQRARLPSEYDRCVHLLVDDRVYSCGEATEEILARTDSVGGDAADLFRLLPSSARERVREPLYRWVADHRSWFGRVLRR